MWISNLKELKKKTGMTTKQIADKTNLPERTINRIFSGETDHPRIDTIQLIVSALGGTFNEIFADTNAIVATETLVEVMESAEVVEAEKDLAVAEIEMLRAKVSAQDIEIALLKEKLQHKEELLAVYNYFTKIKPGE